MVSVILGLPVFIIWFINLMGNVNDLDIQKSLTIILTVLTLLPFMLSMYNKNFNFLSPFYIFLLTYFALFPLRAIYILWNDDYEFMNGINANPGYISQVLIFLILVLLVYYFGYYVSSGSKWAKKIANKENVIVANHSRILKIASLLYFLCAIVGFAFLVKGLGGFNLGKNTDFIHAGVSPYVYDSINLLIPSLLLYYIYLNQNNKNVLLFHVMVACTTVFYTLAGGRVRVAMFLVAYIIMVFFYMKMRAGWFFMIALLSIFILYITLVSINRENWTLTNHSQVSFDMSLVTKNFISSKGDMNIFDTFVLVYEKVPGDIGYEYGASIFSLVIQPIPRTLFPQKPALVSKVIMKTLMPQWDEKGVGFAGSILADLLINFGKVGVLICMFLWGLVTREITVLQKARNPLVILVCAITIGTIPLYVRGEFVLISEGYLIVTVPIFIVLLLIKRNNRQVNDKQSARVTAALIKNPG